MNSLLIELNIWKRREFVKREQPPQQPPLISAEELNRYAVERKVGAKRRLFN
jgi:hypothetical protein